MKPCSKNRKLIAWLALDALNARKAAALRDHLTHCEGCRRYWEGISNVTEVLSSSAADSNLEASESFHRRVAEKLQAAESRSVLNNVAAWLRESMLNRRVALPVILLLVIALFAIVVPRRHPALPLPGSPTVQVVPASSSGSDLAPTIANYQRVANQSLEKLSELLTEQGNKRLPPAPILTVSGLEPANGSF
jgi:hypothetical protein